MKNHETKTGWKRSPEAPHHLVAQAPSWPRQPVVSPPWNSFPSRFSPVTSLRCLILAYITLRIARGLHIVFSSCFFYLFLSGVFRSFRGIMVIVRCSTQLGTPRGRYEEHNSKFHSVVKPRFIKPVGESQTSEGDAC
jgi:hypothetical protein